LSGICPFLLTTSEFTQKNQVYLEAMLVIAFRLMVCYIEPCKISLLPDDYLAGIS
jgi:predicted translin family RNA/ssDNA-binding protein